MRQLLNHTAGWLGDDLQDFGPGDDAVATYTASIARLPILTRPGSTMFYQNSGLVVAGRIVEVVTGMTYERAVKELLLDPLGLDRTRFTTDELIGYPIAARHSVIDGKAHLEPGFWALPRSLNPTGGLMSTVRDQLRYAASTSARCRARTVRPCSRRRPWPPCAAPDREERSKPSCWA